MIDGSPSVFLGQYLTSMVAQQMKSMMYTIEKCTWAFDVFVSNVLIAEPQNFFDLSIANSTSISIGLKMGKHPLKFTIKFTFTMLSLDPKRVESLFMSAQEISFR